MTTTIKVRCKAFSSESVRENQVRIDQDGTVRVWDSTAGHYTTCHSLSAATQRRIRRMAAESREYDYATDGEMGVIVATDFADACRKLDAMFTPAIIADGGHGWVEDHDGQRYSVGYGRGR